MTRRVSLGLLALAALAALAVGCGSSHSSASTSSTPVDAGTAQVATAHHVAAKAVPTGPRSAPVVILMYHVIATAQPGTRNPQLWVPAARFRSQVQALAHAGYNATTLDRVWKAWRGQATMPRHPLVVSFDDGYMSQYTNARPALDALHWPGVLNLEVDNAGPKGLPRHLIKAMVRDGWEIDAHTITHPDLTMVDAARLRNEVQGSRTWIQQQFGEPVDFFCYPSGRYDATVEQAVRAAGYFGATTIQPGRATRKANPFELPRLRVDPGMTGADLVARVRSLTSGRPA